MREIPGVGLELDNEFNEEGWLGQLEAESHSVLLSIE